MRTVLKAIASFCVFLCLLVPAGATANVDDHLDAVCRITAGNSMGSGCVFYIGSDYVYVLTNNHVVTTQKVVGLDFWSTGYQSSRLEGQVLVADPSIDSAVVLVPTGVFGGRLPNAIPLGQPADAPVAGATIVSAGCPGGAWPSAWKGHVLGYTGGDILFVPPVMGGRSGSAILDAEGSKIVGLLWGTNDEHGIAIGIEKLRLEDARADDHSHVVQKVSVVRCGQGPAGRSLFARPMPQLPQWPLSFASPAPARAPATARRRPGLAVTARSIAYAEGGSGGDREPPGSDLRRGVRDFLEAGAAANAYGPRSCHCAGTGPDRYIGH